MDGRFKRNNYNKRTTKRKTNLPKNENSKSTTKKKTKNIVLKGGDPSNVHKTGKN